MSRRLFLAPVLAAFLIPYTASRGARAGSRAARGRGRDRSAGPCAHCHRRGQRDARTGRPSGKRPAEHAARKRRSAADRPTGASRSSSVTGARCTSMRRSTVDVQSDELLRLLDGRVRVTILGPARAVVVSDRLSRWRGEHHAAWRLSRGDAHGERETQLELAVLRGTADIFTHRVDARPRRSACIRKRRARTLIRLRVQFRELRRLRSVDRKPARRAARRLGAIPGAEVQSYAPVLDAEGDWRYNQPYGYVWYPRVATGWRPYYYGRWLSYPRYGWTWVGNDRFGWPTHHYGRWGFSSGAWFWIPGSRWAPAYVSWAYTPGYVSWCPLGFDNRAVFALNVSIGRPYYSSHYSPWNYWTVVAAPHFGYGYVNQRVVHVDRVFAAQSRPVFVSRPSAPAYRGVAVPRGAAPITWAGARGVPSRAARRRDAIDVGPGGRDSNYFLRDSNRADHAVQRESIGLSSGTAIAAGQRRRTIGCSAIRHRSGTSTSAPRAVPRSGGSVPMYQSRPSVGTPGMSTNPGARQHHSRDTARRRAGSRHASARLFDRSARRARRPAGRTQFLRHPPSAQTAPAQDRVAGAGASRA